MSRDWRAEVQAIRRRFPGGELNDMDDCDIIDVCKDFRSVGQAIAYLDENVYSGLWRKAKKANPLRSAQDFERREAREEKRRQRLAGWKQRKKEEAAKAAAAAKAAKKNAAELKPFVATPRHAWGSLTLPRREPRGPDPSGGDCRAPAKAVESRRVVDEPLKKQQLSGAPREEVGDGDLFMYVPETAPTPPPRLRVADEVAAAEGSGQKDAPPAAEASVSAEAGSPAPHLLPATPGFWAFHPQAGWMPVVYISS
jgi:hypothetical protein